MHIGEVRASPRATRARSARGVNAVYVFFLCRATSIDDWRSMDESTRRGWILVGFSRDARDARDECDDLDDLDDVDRSLARVDRARASRRDAGTATRARTGDEDGDVRRRRGRRR